MIFYTVAGAENILIELPLKTGKQIMLTFSFALLLVLITIFPSVGVASTEAYEFGYDHGCEDARISDPSDRYINQPGKGPSTHTNEFMDGYNDGFYVCSSGTNNPDSDYPDYFLDENLSSSDIDRDGNVTLGSECGMRLLIDDQLFQPLSEHQCFFFNSCKNLGGSIPGCYAGARIINCDIESGKGYYCPAVLMDEQGR